MKRLWLLAAFLAFWELLCASPLLAQQQIPITGGVVTADLSSGITSFKVNLNQNVTSVVLTGQRPGSGGNTVIVTLFFVQDGTGNWTVTFGGNITGAFAVNPAALSTTVEQFAFDFTGNNWYATNSGASGASGISGGGTANFFAQFTGPFSIGNAPMSSAGGVTLSSNPFSVNGPLLFPCTNSASGTSQNLLVTFDSNGNCITLPNGNTAKISGVCFSGCGTSGISQIAILGTTPVLLDNQSTINDYLVAGANGQAHDAGVTYPTGVQVIGLAESVNVGTGTTANGNISILNILNAAGTSGNTLQVNGATLAGGFINFSNTTPAAQANNQNLVFQTDNSTPTSNVSVEVPLATAGQAGIIKLAQDLCGTDLLPDVCGIQTIPVTFTGIAANDVICFPTTSTLGNCHPGVPIRTFSTGGDTILATDRTGWVRPTTSGAVATTLPQAGSAGFTSNFVFATLNNATGTDTITPTTSTINGGANVAVLSNWFAMITSDNTNYFAAIMPTFPAFPACPDVTGNHLNFTTAGGITCGTSGGGGGGGGTVTSLTASAPLVATPSPIVATGSYSCPTCVTSAASLTSTSLVAGAGGQGVAVITTPAQCGAGQAAAGITATGAANGCFTPAGSGVSSVTASGFLASSGGTTPNITVAHSQGTDTNLLTAGTVSGTNALLCTDANAGATTSSCAASASQIPSSIRTRGLVFSYGDPGGSAITAGSTATDYMTVPFACTIAAWNLGIDGGTITVKFWKVATGTAIPTVTNSINTSGVGISSGTAIHSTTLTDFTTTTVSANDIIAMNVSAATTAKFVTGTLECDQ